MTCLTFGQWLFSLALVHVALILEHSVLEQECVISKSFTFSLLCGVDCAYCVGSCAIICMYSSLVYSLYKCF